MFRNTEVFVDICYATPHYTSDLQLFTLSSGTLKKCHFQKSERMRYVMSILTALSMPACFSLLLLDMYTKS